MNTLRLMRETTNRACAAFAVFIVAVDEATSTLESFMDVMCVLRQWGEVERLVSGEYAPFVLRELTND